MNGNILSNGVDGVSIANSYNTSDLTVIDSGGKQGGRYNCAATSIAGSSQNAFFVQCKHFVQCSSYYGYTQCYDDCGYACNFAASSCWNNPFMFLF